MTFFEWYKTSQLENIDAKLILKKITGYTMAQLAARWLDPIEECWLEPLKHLRNRRLAGEPMAYIIGYQEFYGRCFITTPDVLIPRPETEHLIDYILQAFPASTNLNVWDLATGSGIIGITLQLERPHWHILASDISVAALKIAQKNNQVLGSQVIFTQGSWFNISPLPMPASFDLLVSNPPYIPAGDQHLSQGDLRFEPPIALTDFQDGLKNFRILVQGARKWLKAGGHICLEHGYNQGQRVRELLQQHSFTKIKTFPDYAGIDRLTVAVKPSA
ncbi:MAG: peptide chain release factor N(5)-glutamine methyltransferase [Neisseriaceae bacterium]